MKKISFVLVTGFWLLVTASLYSDAINLFDAANAFYEKGEYKSAIEKYEEIIKKDIVSGPLYYNLGNSYFKLGVIFKTILYYERAKKIMPNDPELKFNISYVESLLADKIPLPDGNWLMKKLDRAVHALNLGKWIGFVLAVWLAFSIACIIAIFLIGFRNAFKYISAVCIIFLILGISSALLLHQDERVIRAIVLVKEVSARYGPGNNEVEAFLLHEGTKVSVKNREAGWLQIQLPDGKTGWVTEGSVEVI